MINTLTKHELYKMGSFDNGGRYYLDDIFETETIALDLWNTPTE